MFHSCSFFIAPFVIPKPNTAFELTVGPMAFLVNIALKGLSEKVRFNLYSTKQLRQHLKKEKHLYFSVLP